MNSKAKGSAFERLVAAEIHKLTGVRTTRNLEQTRSGGSDLVGFPGWCIECKIRKDGAWIQEAWWDQVMRESTKLQLKPALIFRVSRQPIRSMFLHHLAGQETRIVTSLEAWATYAGIKSNDCPMS